MKIITRSFYFIFLFSIVFSCKSTEKSAPPNILWVVSEDNSCFFGCYGDSIATTPNLDKFATEGILYNKAYVNAPVCAPSRATLITGMHPISLGLENMRSKYAIPEFVKFYPHYLKNRGYYTSNNSKKDYNTTDQSDAWNESGKNATYKNRLSGQPFFHIINLNVTHESSLHKGSTPSYHNPDDIKLPAYHPDNKAMRSDWAVYYDRIKDMDEQVGKILQQLDDDGLKDNTIVFYYSDHGGVLGRSKRFLFESGLKVPLIIRFPKKYQHLAPSTPGTTSDRLVSFLDLPPTLLNLADIEIPTHMQGRPFLGEIVAPPNAYAFASRARMDERFDLSRSVTDGNFRYTRNFMPHRPYGQHLGYLWKAPSMKSWAEAFKANDLNPIQEAFFLPKPYEELYDINKDPDNVHNLAKDKNYQSTLYSFRNVLDQWQIENHDLGLIPEVILNSLSLKGPIASMENLKQFPVEKILTVAKMAASGNPKDVNTLNELLQHRDVLIRYWAAIGLTIQGREVLPIAKSLKDALISNSPVVGIVIAEALYHVDEKELALNYLIKMINHDKMLVRLQAVNVLETLGNDALKAIPAIKKVIKSKENRGYDNRAMWRILEKFELTAD